MELKFLKIRNIRNCRQHVLLAPKEPVIPFALSLSHEVDFFQQTKRNKLVFQKTGNKIVELIILAKHYSILWLIKCSFDFLIITLR